MFFLLMSCMYTCVCVRARVSLNLSNWVGRSNRCADALYVCVYVCVRVSAICVSEQGCSATARFNTVIDTEYVNAVAQSAEEGAFFTVFLKVQAFCVPAFAPLPPSPPPPAPSPIDPCSCRNRSPPLGCERQVLCASNTICYLDVPCPGFSPSSSKPGLFYDCVPFGSVSRICG